MYKIHTEKKWIAAVSRVDNFIPLNCIVATRKEGSRHHINLVFINGIADISRAVYAACNQKQQNHRDSDIYVCHKCFTVEEISEYSCADNENQQCNLEITAYCTKRHNTLWKFHVIIRENVSDNAVQFFLLNKRQQLNFPVDLVGFKRVARNRYRQRIIAD